MAKNLRIFVGTAHRVTSVTDAILVSVQLVIIVGGQTVITCVPYGVRVPSIVLAGVGHQRTVVRTVTYTWGKKETCLISAPQEICFFLTHTRIYIKFRPQDLL